MIVPGSNVVNIVHDLLRKCKTSDPMCWQQFGRQMRAANIPMELVEHFARRRHIQQWKWTLTPKQIQVDEYNFPTIRSLIKTRALSPWWGRNYSNYTTIGSYGGVAALRRVVPEHDVQRWLSEHDTYTLHKHVRRRFKRRCVVVGGPNQQWQADLVDISRL